MNHTTAAQYGIKRFLRMYPVYWVAILITFPLVTYLLPSRSVSVKEMITNFTMLQGFIGAGNVDGAYWTLQHELSFYIIIGMIIFLKFNKHIEKLCVTWVITRIVLLTLPDILLFNYMRKAFRLFFWGNTYGHMFISGAILRCIEIRLLNQQKMNKNRLWLCVLSLALLCCVILQFYFFSFTYGVIYAAFLILIIVAIYANKRIIELPSKVMKILKPVLFIASISYPLYLIHQNIGYIIIKNMEKIGLTSEIWLVVPIMLMIGLASILNRVVEEPCAKLAKQLCKKISAGNK